VTDPLSAISGALGTVDSLLVVALAVKLGRGRGVRHLIGVLRDPPAPPALRVYGDFVEIVFWCWLLVLVTAVFWPEEPVLEGLAQGSTLLLTASSVLYLASLLRLPLRG
jgi:hypothetical protein